jgi:hypothetical protein
MKEIGEAIRFAGDVAIRKLEIISSTRLKVDVTNQLLSVEIYEDMFSPFMTMTVSLKESLDFINALPLRGEEILVAEISTPTLYGKSRVISGRFYIYKLGDRQHFTDNNTGYTLKCISYEALLDMNNKISKAFSGNISSIANKLIKSEGLNTDKDVIIEPTKNSIKYVSNFWSAAKNLNVLASSAINNNSSPSFLFFENRNGFNFVSLDTLFKSSIFTKFIKDNYVRDVGNNTSFRNLDRDYSRILDIKVETGYDALKHITSGTYSSKMFSYDIVRKKLNIKDYNALQNFNKRSHLNKNPLYSNLKPVTASSAILTGIRHYESHQGFADTSEFSMKQERMSSLQLLRSFNIQITVFGRTDYTVGQKVNLELPKPTVLRESATASTDKNRGFIDSTYSGNYIITAINHVINLSSHTCVMELCKESFID